VPSLKSIRVITLDVGDKDPFVSTNRQLGEPLTRLDVPHTFDTYDGDHGNRVRERFESHVVPFFSRHVTAAR
jgi:enterochelin esterase-like enzyme